VIDVQQLYGLVVRADFPLHQDRPAPAHADPDVVLELAPPVPAPAGLPDGEVVLHCEIDRSYYAIARQPDGRYLFRILGVCDFDVSADLGHAVVRPFEGTTSEMAAILATGGLLAFQLYLRGHLVLHASAVEVGGRALAFVGHSGMGKSTMAALMCAGGAHMVTDDVLRVDLTPDGPVARLGATDVRLRKGADVLADRFEADRPGRRTSADDRQVLRLPPTARDGLPLDAVVIPAPTRSGTSVELTRLPPKDALFTLLGFPRLLGWTDPAVLSRTFASLSALVAATPVHVASVPWGPPFHPGIAAEVAALVRSDQPGSASR
jgi:hypothetical protein